MAKLVVGSLVVGMVSGACGMGLEPEETRELARAAPRSVSQPEAWRLFDRSVSSGFTPGGDAILVGLDRSDPIAAIKVRGPAPYRVQVRGPGDTSLGLPPIDLSTLDAGWHVVEAASLV